MALQAICHLSRSCKLEVRRKVMAAMDSQLLASWFVLMVPLEREFGPCSSVQSRCVIVRSMSANFLFLAASSLQPAA